MCHIPDIIPDTIPETSLRDIVAQKSAEKDFQKKCQIYETLFSLGFIPSENRMFGKLQLPTGELNIEIFANVVGDEIFLKAAKWEWEDNGSVLMETAYRKLNWSTRVSVEEVITFVEEALQSCKYFFDFHQRKEEGVWFKKPKYGILSALVRKRTEELIEELHKERLTEIREIIKKAGFSELLVLPEVQIYKLTVKCFLFFITVRVNTTEVRDSWGETELFISLPRGIEQAIEWVRERIYQL